MEVTYNNVTYVYNEKTSISHKALDNINLSIKEVSITGIIGKSGSGKTTLIELLEALIIPSKGTIKVNDFIIKKSNKIKKINELRQLVGIVFQFPEEQFFNLTVKEEVGFGLKAFNYKNHEYDKRVLDSLKLVGLDSSYLDRDPFELSNGEQRKVAISSVLAYNPKLIIFDEPTIGLDDNSKKNLIKLIRLLKNKYNKTIIIVSHDMNLINEISDYLVVINNGKIVLNDTKDEVLKKDISKYDLKKPVILEFIDMVYKEKNIKLPYRSDLNDTLKDVLRNVE